MSLAARFGSLAAIVITVAATAMQAGEPPQRVHPLANTSLAPALKAAAARDQIDLNERDNAAAAPAAGDSVVFWIGALQGRQSQQWLVQLTRGTASDKELAKHRGRDKTKYISWGSVVVFHSEVEPIDLWIAGPADTANVGDAAPASVAPAPVHRRRVFVPRDYLRLGLDDSQRVSAFMAARVREIVKQEPGFKPGHIYALDDPIKPEKIAYAKPTGDRLGLTPAMERAWMGGYVALQSFYDTINEVPELREIAEIALEKPSLFKLAKLATGTHFMTGFGGSNGHVVDPARVGLFPARDECFEVPFSFAFGRDPIVSGSMIVTAPAAPLDVSAGIIAVIAFHPQDSTRVVEMVAMAAHHTHAKTAVR